MVFFMYRPKRITLIGWFLIIWNSFLTLSYVPQAYFGLSMSFTDALIQAINPIYIFFIIIGVALLLRKNWARVLYIVVAPLLLTIDFIFGYYQMGLEGVLDLLPALIIRTMIVLMLESHCSKKWFKKDDYKTFSYAEIVWILGEQFRDIKGTTELIRVLKPFSAEEVLLDTAELEEIRVLTNHLPFVVKLFSIKEEGKRFVEVEAYFTNYDELVNLRVQLFFPSPEDKKDARKYWEKELTPFIINSYKERNLKTDYLMPNSISFEYDKIIAVSRLVPDLPSVSCWFTDIEYAF